MNSNILIIAAILLVIVVSISFSIGNINGQNVAYRECTRSLQLPYTLEALRKK